MVEYIDMVKAAVKGVNTECVQITEINRGVKVEFTDNETDRRYELLIREIN